ncbi:MAG: cation:proton antiporter [Myxococcales bacterium]|nr:cation:proton antiporter [Myxococcales bacterium]
MDPVSVFLIVVAAIFILGVIGEVAFERTGVPDVVWLIGVGMLLGPITGILSRERLLAVAPYFGALTLVIVLFDGGSSLRLSELGKAAGRGSTTALLSFCFSVAAVTAATALAGVFGWLPESWNWMHGLLVGAIVGGSSSVIIMPALSKARLSSRLSTLLSLESAITDVLCVVVAVAVIRVVVSGSTDFVAAAGELGRGFGIGLGVGCVTGLLLILVLRRLRKSSSGYPIILGTLLLLYVLVDSMGGSAALAILSVAAITGNAPALSNVIGLAKQASLGRSIEGFHDQMTFIVKSFFFTFIGAMLGPPWSLVAVGLGLSVVLLIARVPAVWLGLLGAGFPPSARTMVIITLPRGMAAGVLAMLPHQMGVPDTELLPVAIFAAVVGSIAIFAVGFPIYKGRLPAELLEVGPAAVETSARESVPETPSLPPSEPPPAAPAPADS